MAISKAKKLDFHFVTGAVRYGTVQMAIWSSIPLSTMSMTVVVCIMERSGAEPAMQIQIQIQIAHFDEDNNNKNRVDIILIQQLFTVLIRC